MRSAMKMGLIFNILVVLPFFFQICIARELYMDKQELGSFLKNFYSNYAPSNSRNQRDLSFIPPGASVYQEPSFRDLDVGIGIGVKDDDSDLVKHFSSSSFPLNTLYAPQDQSKEVTFGVYVDPRNGVSYHLPQGLQTQQFSNGYPQQTAIPNMNYDPTMFISSQPTSFIGPVQPRQPYDLQPSLGYGTGMPSMKYPTDYSAQRVPTLPFFVPTEQSNRYEMPAALPFVAPVRPPGYDTMYPIQPFENSGGFRYPGYTTGGRTFRKFFGIEENRPFYRRDQFAGFPRGNAALTPRYDPAQIILDPQGVPVMSAEPYGERQVGGFRLRNDHGYQVTMNVPRMPEDGPSDGVLVMEMKATLYRPLQ